MGYQIRYEGTESKRPAGKRFAAGLGAAVLATVVLAACLWPQAGQRVRQVVFPGDPALTAAAMEELSQELKTGVPLSQAWRQFCRSILHDEDPH